MFIIPYINLDALTNRIRYFDIVRKKEENAGVEFADFIAYNLFKFLVITCKSGNSGITIPPLSYLNVSLSI